MTESISLSATIAEQLEDEILTGKRSLGDRLDERELAKNFKASRTPVREALQRLAATGLVQINGRHGTNVARLTLPQLLDGFRVASELEAIAAFQAAGRITENQVALLWKYNKECEDAFAIHDHAAFCVANDYLHNTILQASGNWMLKEQMRVARVLGPYRRHITYQPGRMESSLCEHEACIKGIIAGEGIKASDQMRTHVNALATGLSDFLFFLNRTGQSQIIASEH